MEEVGFYAVGFQELKTLLGGCKDGFLAESSGTESGGFGVDDEFGWGSNVPESLFTSFLV